VNASAAFAAADVAPPLVRVGPVHFQSLESELQPVVGYLGGHLLDAGSGTRDIATFLHGHGVARITRYDMAARDPGSVAGALESMPFPDATFDAVLCNAVIEHVADAERATAELARVVAPAGHVVVAVPFLQPYHPCPGDYQRYTADGLAELGRRAGLEVVTVLPVHSLAQTLAWIVWEQALEKGGTIRRGAAWGLAYLSTRWCVRTDMSARRSANTYQAVFRRRA
jgi:ubiquinone/menaquinone biosynthesis C-methylase UbiE